MPRRQVELQDPVWNYLTHRLQEPEPLARLREETSKLDLARMQIGIDQGAFMGWLVRALGVKRALEIGTFTGYSALSIARALPDDGQLICCDRSEEFVSYARRYAAIMKLQERIRFVIAPANETLAALEAEGNEFDFVFIDADKTGYDHYYEACLRMLRAGGAILIDNVLWGGSVADPADTTEDTVALRALNDKIASDERVDQCTIPIGDGVTLVRKR